MSAQNGFQFTLRGRPGGSYLIESSIDLKTWRPVTTLNLEMETKAFVDPTPEEEEFYRASLVD